MGRILCLDVGEKRTGVAVSDETRTVARGLRTIEHDNPKQLIEEVGRLVIEHDVELVVVGLPVSLSGRPTARSEAVRRFSRRLSALTRRPVELFEEDLSTARANEVLEETYGGPRHRTRRASTGLGKRRRQAVDRIAATIILEDYLAAQEG